MFSEHFVFQKTKRWIKTLETCKEATIYLALRKTTSQMRDGDDAVQFVTWSFLLLSWFWSFLFMQSSLPHTFEKFVDVYYFEFSDLLQKIQRDSFPLVLLFPPPSVTKTNFFPLQLFFSNSQNSHSHAI